MDRGRAVGFAALVGLLCLLPLSAQAASYGVNLIDNPGAEAGMASQTGNPVTVPGWTNIGGATVVPYGSPGGFPSVSDPGPPDRFTNPNRTFFAGGNQGDSSSLIQTIDVPGNAADIDSGKVTADIEAWLGGYAAEKDSAVFTVSFFDASGFTKLDEISVSSPVHNVTGLFHQAGIIPVPAKTRSIHFLLVFTRFSGNFDDGYADSLSVVLRGPIVVTTTADSGTGSLRAAIPAATQITFDPSIHTVNLTDGTLTLSRDLTITGPGADKLTVQRSTPTGTPLPNFGIFTVSNGTLTGPIVALSGLTISNGTPSFGGGGIYNAAGTLTVNSCTVSGNSSQYGGGIYNAAGALTVNSSTVSGNSATGFSQNAGGGIYNDGGTMMINNSAITDNPSADKGGGIANSGGTATIDKCTISGNSASNYGGGLLNQGSALMKLINCTLSGNSADDGGSAYNYALGGAAASLTMSNCTLSGNSASFGGGGGIFNDASTSGGTASVLVDNTIFKTGASGVNIKKANGTITSNGYNLSNDDGGGFFNLPGVSSDRINTDPKLGPLQDNGGPTFTHALLAGSPAIDFGKSNLTTDQRGAPRPVDDPNSANGGGNKSDVGAFEVQVTPQVVLANISGRLPVGTGDNALFAGFIVTGYQPKKVILRAIGPSLGIAGSLANPTLELHDASGALLQSNDDWKQSMDKQAIIDSTIPPTNDLESAIVATLPASPSGTNYTAIVRGVGNATGIGVVEVYDLDRTVDSKLANISNRGFVQTGDNALFAGNIVVGQASQNVIIRAIGPSLSVPGAMADPTLELRDANGSLLEANDNWVDSPNKQAIIASTIPPTNNLESAIVRTLAPANYTAIVRGAGGTTGIAVVEVYALQ